MIMYYILNSDHSIGTAKDVHEWASFFESLDKRIVKHDMVGKHLVSTVFLGIDHNFFGKGPPILFETMIFDLDEEYQTRCSTWDEAVVMHQEAIEYLERQAQGSSVKKEI